MKRGRFSVEEMEFMSLNAEVLSPEAISKTINRSTESIKDWIVRNVGISSAQKKEVAVANELRTKPYFKELLNQFSHEELEMFEFHFKKMWSQFKDDVFHTEEMQIIDTIKLEVLMNRILRSQQSNQNEIISIERIIQGEKAVDKDQRDVDLIINMERQVAVLRASQETLSRDYKDLQARKSTMLKDLKGTREQRIKAIEDSKQTFASLVKKLATNENFRNNVGIEMEKMRLATEKEIQRLAEYSQYDDGLVDRPLLNSNTVNFGEDE